MALKWGFVSAGKISNQFAQAISVHPQENKIIAVAARDISRAEEFAKTYNIPKAYGNYENLAKDEEVDIVYVGNLNPQHLEVSKLMLENGKHVLCEKPLTMNERQTRELIELAKSKKLFLMEAVWSRCFPVYDEVKRIIDSGEIGEVMYVGATFGRPLNHIDRLNAKELGGGTILDLGVYCLQFQQFIFRGMKPTKVVATGHLNQCETDESTSAILTYEGGKTAVFTTSAVLQLPNQGIIVGTKGTLKLQDFWHPSSLETPKGRKEFELPKTKYNSPAASGLSYEVQEVHRCIKAGLTECPKITHAESLQLAQLMDELRRQVGVVYPEDSV